MGEAREDKIAEQITYLFRGSLLSLKKFIYLQQKRVFPTPIKKYCQVWHMLSFVQLTFSDQKNWRLSDLIQKLHC